MENAMVIMNHWNTLDWTMVSILAARRLRLANQRFMAKNEIFWYPILGMGMYFHGCFFLKRNWAQDKAVLDESLKDLSSSTIPFWFVFYPEGTRKTPAKLAQSQSYGKKNNLPILSHVLLPRTLGFVTMAQSLRHHMDCLYDCTLGFADGSSPSVYDMMAGNYTNKDLYLHVRRFGMDKLPTENKDLADWLVGRYVEKDRQLAYLQRNGKFMEDDLEDPLPFSRLAYNWIACLQNNPHSPPQKPSRGSALKKTQ